jgi:hypothetical protein
MITYDEFEDKYKPITNHFDDNASLSGCMFETYGEELEYVLSIAITEPLRVWTYVADYEPVELIQGYHVVNRIGYIITEIPVEPELENLEVCDPDCARSVIDDKRNMVVDDVFDSCLNDSNYMYSVLKRYYATMSEETIAQLYKEAFADN